jgi:acyl carrier protein
MSAPDAGEVLTVIREIGSRELELQDIQPADELVANLGLDSLTMTTLLVELENRYRIHLTEVEGSPVVTVGDLVSRVVQLCAEELAA